MSRAPDGFNVMFPYLPEGLDDFVDKVVPELQTRGIFRKEYEGRTLRDNLGLPRRKTASSRPKSRISQKWIPVLRPEYAQKHGFRLGIRPVLAWKTLTLGDQRLGCAANAGRFGRLPDIPYI